MMKPIIYTLNKKDYIDKAFKTIPDNSFIFKGRCGIGGTTLEINAKRHSIIAVPTKGIITDKCNTHGELFGVDGGVSVEEIAMYLQSDAKYKKLMTTPDSISKIIMAAVSIGMLYELYQDFFMLLDECHTSVTESFRRKILEPFKYFWNFKRKSLISATPIKLSDERFQQLQHIYIRFHEKYLGSVILRPTGNVDACIDYYINTRAALAGKLFIFYNSVREVAECIRRHRLSADNAHIYCADNSDNYDKLSESLLVFQREPTNGKYASINFFTCKYFEGIDIKEEDATIILVTDVHKAHTKVGITNKGVQAIGRLRNQANEIIHITNHRDKQGMKAISEFKKEYQIHIKLIENYNSYVLDCKSLGILPLEDSATAIDRFTDIDEETKLATFNITRLDQVLNELVCNEQFNSIDTIKDSWEESLFEVTVNPYSAVAPKRRKSKADVLKEAIQLIAELWTSKERYETSYVNSELERIKNECALAHKAYFALDLTTIEELKYNEKAIKAAIAEKHNKDMEAKLLAHLDNSIDIGERYPIEKLVSMLDFAYKLLQILNPKTGDIQKANATDLQEPGRYTLQKCKIEQHGKQVNGYIIVNRQFSFRQAA